MGTELGTNRLWCFPTMHLPAFRRLSLGRFLLIKAREREGGGGGGKCEKRLTRLRKTRMEGREKEKTLTVSCTVYEFTQRLRRARTK